MTLLLFVLFKISENLLDRAAPAIVLKRSIHTSATGSQGSRTLAICLLFNELHVLGRRLGNPLRLLTNRTEGTVIISALLTLSFIRIVFVRLFALPIESTSVIFVGVPPGPLFIGLALL